MPEQTVYCKHCNSELHGEYCSSCGRHKELKRINGHYVLSEIGSVLNFDKGILFTIRELFLRPGKNIQTFIIKDRNCLIKPILFLIICSLIYTVAQQFMDIQDGYIHYSGLEDSAISKMFTWVQRNYGYANIFMAVFIAFWIKILFKKYDYNFFEILILLCFVIGIAMLIYSVFGIIENFAKIKVLQIGGVVGFLYTSWAIGQFFDKHKKMNYFKGFLSYMLGMLSFTLAAFALGFLIDLIMK